MHAKIRRLAVCLGLVLAGASQAAAASAKSYQVTGPITELNPTTITLEKNSEKWEIARNPEAKGDANLKVGDHVIIHYRMVATSIDAKGVKNDAASDASTKDEPAPATAKNRKNP